MDLIIQRLLHLSWLKKPPRQSLWLSIPIKLRFVRPRNQNVNMNWTKSWHVRAVLFYYGIIVHNDRLYVITSFEIFEIFIRHEIHTTRNSYERPNSYELHVVRFSCSKVFGKSQNAYFSSGFNKLYIGYQIRIE